MASNRKRAMSTLPSLEMLVGQAKRHKSAVKELHDCCERLAEMNADELPMNCLSKLSDDEKICWLFSKYGSTTVVNVCKALKAVPVTVTDAQQLKFVQEISGINEEKVIILVKFITEACPGLIDMFTFQDFPLILAPPVTHCYDCEQRLVSNHTCQVRCFTTEGLRVAMKVTLRCKDCKLAYNYSQFGSKEGLGFRFYPVEREYVEASDTSFFQRSLVELQCCLANHSWVSFQGFCEAYNDAFSLPGGSELSQRLVGEAFYNGELESELRRIGKIDFRFKKDGDRDHCMEMIEVERRCNNYPHPSSECVEECKKRGCGRLWVTDGIWKVAFPHCMFRVEHSVPGIPNINLPDVCAKTPAHGSAFCKEHCDLLQQEAPTVPTALKAFLDYCGTQNNGDDVVDEETDSDKVDKVVGSIQVRENSLGESAVQSQGTDRLVAEHPALMEQVEIENPGEPLCQKNIGSGKKLRKWSRGHQFVVRGGGIIDTWQPLYRSESPSQVFLIILQWLICLVKQCGSLPSVILAYDNMCNLDRLKVARRPLPLAPPLDCIWNKVEDYRCIPL